MDCGAVQAVERVVGSVCASAEERYKGRLNKFFPRKSHLERTMWTDNDRNMSHFFMKAFTDFARYGGKPFSKNQPLYSDRDSNPTLLVSSNLFQHERDVLDCASTKPINPSHQQILGLHFDVARNGELRYLNINTTFNSSIQLNYRQTEAAFWSMYLPTVVGHLVPTYPPITEFWWEPKQPLQIAFWSISGLCLLLVVAVVIFCILWRNAKRKSDGYYNGDITIMRDDIGDHGIDNHSTSNMFEYRDTPPPHSKPKRHSNNFDPKHSVSSPSLRAGSASSLKDTSAFRTSSPTVEPKLTQAITNKNPIRNKTQVDSSGVPQTQLVHPRYPAPLGVPPHFGFNTPQIGESTSGGGHPPLRHLERRPTGDLLRLLTISPPIDL
uniref:Uncharacterized protein n=1 Tax=Timema tahoe TaxID=61484 RepID=A0A7R9FKA1_9NEOP|nr:unnamed protein product [Timema tahoe]